MRQDSVLWLGETEARLIHLSDDRMERKSIRAARPDELPHHHCAPLFRSGSAFFHAIVTELVSSERLLVLGAWQAVLAFKAFLRDHFPALCDRVMSWERMDKPVDSEIASFASRFFTGGAQEGNQS